MYSKKSFYMTSKCTVKFGQYLPNILCLGQSLNPAIDIGQIEGAFMQGKAVKFVEC